MNSIVKGVLVFAVILLSVPAGAEPVDPIDPDSRCPVCGMMPAKYPLWIAQIHAVDGEPVFFDGVKDMMAYYFEPEVYGGSPSLDDADIYVRDYYRQEYIDGRSGFYVVGSDVMGPMGYELIPFAERGAAEQFLADHNGDTILSFTEITLERINEMRQAHMLKMKKNKGNMKHDHGAGAMNSQQ
jgi:copper chaperone NosL